MTEHVRDLTNFEECCVSTVYPIPSYSKNVFPNSC